MALHPWSYLLCLVLPLGEIDQYLIRQLGWCALSIQNLLYALLQRCLSFCPTKDSHMVNFLKHQAVGRDIYLLLENRLLDLEVGAASWRFIRIPCSTIP
jgi:hypothetical protein